MVAKFGIEGSLVDPNRKGGALPEAIANLNRLRFFFSGSDSRDADESRFDLSDWSYSPEHNTLITWEFTPSCTYPTEARFVVEVATSEQLKTQLQLVGLPVPVSEPQVIVGAHDADLRHVVFKPGPPGLASLEYAVFQREGRCYVIALCERPPEPEFSTLVEKYENDYPYEGTRFYDSLRKADADERRVEMTLSVLPMSLV